MNISIIGTGYVGLITGTCLAQLGMNVICMDINQDKIDSLKKGVVPIFEPELEEMLKKNIEYGRLTFTTDISKAVSNSNVIFIAVDTPSQQDGLADLHYIFDAAKNIAVNMEKYKVIVVKSTVPIGTGNKVKDRIQEILKKHKKEINFDIVSNPEFLREGSAIKDFMKPDRIVIGAQSQIATDIMKEIYKNQILFDIPLICTDIETAEMIKHASNAFLATKVSFINEVANICELGKADAIVVSKTMGLDKRIGPQFLSPGPGFGGSCFPKDIKAFINMGDALGYAPEIVKSVLNTNERQKKRMVEKIKNIVGKLEGKTITILGIAFKPNTDDIRESPAIAIIKDLLKDNAKVNAYDPQAMDNVKKIYPELSINYCDDAYTACKDTDCIVVATEWEEFKELDFNIIKNVVRNPNLLDLRNMYLPNDIRQYGFIYRGVGRE